MKITTRDVIRFISDRFAVDYACISETINEGQLFQLHACTGFEQHDDIQDNTLIKGNRAVAMSALTHDEVVFDNQNREIKSLVSLSLAGLKAQSGTIIPIQGTHQHWGALIVLNKEDCHFSQEDIILLQKMARIISTVVLDTPAAESLSEQAKNIIKAKRQWETTVDSLPQLVIGLNQNIEIIRANKTIETWGLGKVHETIGLSISDFLKPLTGKTPNSSIFSNVSDIGSRLKQKQTLKWVSKENDDGRSFQFTLKKVDEGINDELENDDCFAVLIIDDISAYQQVERNLKKHTLSLRKKISERTHKLKLVNKQLQEAKRDNETTKIELKNTQQCRQKLLQKLINTQENERKRIAGELHDSVGQSLGATKFKIEALLMSKRDVLSDEDFEQFSEIVDKLKSAIEEVRHISMDLRPSILDDLGILATLRWFCREYESTYTGTTIMQLLNVDEADISEDIKVVIFRIVQEAMNNTAKHASATDIKLELNEDGTDLHLSISDNGCGFQCETGENGNSQQQGAVKRCGFGMSNMRERAESTNGLFSIESAPDKGLTINVCWKNVIPRELEPTDFETVNR